MKLAAPLTIVLHLVASLTVNGQVVLADAYNVPANGTGFGLNSGVNAGINPPLTRLTGLSAAGLRYIATATKATTAFDIFGGKLRVTPAANPGRFTFSENGTTPFNLGPALGAQTASPVRPVTYEASIRMANASADLQRFSFALGSAEGDATTWDFGVQVYRTADTDNFYTIGKRIDVRASGLSADLNAPITNTVPGTYGSELTILIRVTDAGAETNSFSSRVQLSLDSGTNWCYDTANDPALPNGWRWGATARYVMWDVAPGAGPVTYDDFSIRLVPVSAVLVSPVANATVPGVNPVLQAAVSNTSGNDVAVTFYGREAPKPFPGPDFAIAALPDTQNYARQAAGIGDAVKEMWFAQTEWIITNRVYHNIAYVAHLGDIVHNGDIKDGAPNTTEWRNATNAMYRIENPGRTLQASGIPYGMCVGNHDQEPNGAASGSSSLFNEYFGVTHFEDKPYYGGHFGNDNDNHFDLFSASGLDFIVLYFEYGRYGQTVLDWANAVLSTNQHRRLIVVTHHAGSPSTPSNLSAQGEALYEGLKHNPGFFLMLGGHVDGEGSRADTYNGRTVRTFISDYQFRTNGGSGWMRLMYFSPSNNTVQVKTFSPWLNRYETDANSQMTFSYHQQLPGGPGSPGSPWVALGTNHAVASESISSFAWSGVAQNRAYEWYVSIRDDSGNTFRSGVERFNTSTNAMPVISNANLTVTGDRPTSLTLQAWDANGDTLSFRANPPIHGLISNFDPNNGTLTYTPAHGFRGLDAFSCQVSDGVADSGVGIVRLNVIAPADINANGLPDDWEQTYGVSDPAGDPDGDGQSNSAEYLANTNPTNTVSAFRILSSTIQPEGYFRLSWASTGGTRYRVFFADNETNSGITGQFAEIPRFIGSEMDASPYGAASTQSYLDTFTQTGMPTNNARYYRVKTVP